MSESEKSGIDRLQDRIVSHGIASLTEAERQMYGIHWLFLETYNGGLHQFFFNDVGQFAQAALNGLEAVGAPKTADIIRRAIAIFPNSRVPVDQGERRDIMCDFSEQQEQAFDELTTEFFRCTADEEDVAELVPACRGESEVIPDSVRK